METHTCFGFSDVLTYPKLCIVFNCPVCRKYWFLDDYFKYLMGQGVTPNNYIGHYTSWCTRNNFSPLRFDVLQFIFENCVTNDDFKDTLDALYTIQNLGTKLTFMLTKDPKDLISVLTIKLKIRLELFNRVPTGNNMILAYSLMEELTLKTFAEGNLNVTERDEKSIDRFDKLKNLALGTKFISERTNAFNRSLDIFKKLTKLEV